MTKSKRPPEHTKELDPSELARSVRENAEALFKNRSPRVDPLDSERDSQHKNASLMRELEVRTARIRRGWIDRLKGHARLYETKVTDGERAAYGRGPSREASEHAALRNWNNRFNDLDTREPE